MIDGSDERAVDTYAKAADIVVLSRCSWTLYNFRRNLMRELQKVFRHVICIGGGGDGFDLKLQSEGFEFQPAHVSRRGIDVFQDLVLFIQLWRRFKREHPTIVHSFTIKPAIYGTLAAAMAGVPVRIVTITGIGHVFITGKSWLRWAVKMLYRAALSRADFVFFQNTEDRSFFLENRLVSAKRTALVPGFGVDTERFVPAPLPYLDRGVPTFLMIGRLIIEKGIREYVKAARIVKKRHPSVRFQLIGGIESRNPSALTEKDFLKLNADGAVEWIGEVDDVRQYIASSDVAVLPSYREGTPRSMLEAAAMGRPILTTDAVGCREVVIDGVTGYSVPIANVEALVDAFTKFIEDPSNIETMGQAGRDFIKNRFDERTVIEMTVASYRRLFREKACYA